MYGEGRVFVYSPTAPMTLLPALLLLCGEHLSSGTTCAHMRGVRCTKDDKGRTCDKYCVFKLT